MEIYEAYVESTAGFVKGDIIKNSLSRHYKFKWSFAKRKRTVEDFSLYFKRKSGGIVMNRVTILIYYDIFMMARMMFTPLLETSPIHIKSCGSKLIKIIAWHNCGSYSLQEFS